MPSTFTSNLGVEKPGDGEQSGTWGGTVNDNMDILDRATNGAVTLTLTGASSNLTTTDGGLSDGQNKLLLLTGALSASHTINVLPVDAEKVYFIQNDSGDSVVISQGSGSKATITDGTSAVVYCDGGGSSASVTTILGDALLATAADIRSLTSENTLTPAAVATALVEITPSGTANWQPAWDEFIAAEWVVTDDRTLSFPTDVIPGTTRAVTVKGSGGTHTISLASGYKGVVFPVEVSTTSFSTLFMYALSSSEVLVSVRDWS